MFAQPFLGFQLLKKSTKKEQGQWWDHTHTGARSSEEMLEHHVRLDKTKQH